MNDIIRNIVSKLREVYPNFKLEFVVDDIESSVEHLGINILYSDMDDLEKSGRVVSGFARVNSKTHMPEIVVNGNEPSYRRRFTIAHELGHIILHWKWLPGKDIDPKYTEISYRGDFDYSHGDRQREKQANEFAAELLLPLSEVREILEHSMENRTFLKHKLADKYKVSMAMADIQLTKAGR